MLDTDDPFEREIADLAAASREHAHLIVQREQLRAEIERATEEVAVAQRELREENQEVQQLASFSITGVAARIRGTHDSDLRQQLAARQAARLTLAAAEDRLSHAMTELPRIEDRLVAIGDIHRRRAELEERRQRWQAVAGEPAQPPTDGAGDSSVAHQLSPSTDRHAAAHTRGQLEEERREVDEALAAGHLAAARLAHAAIVTGGRAPLDSDEAVDAMMATLRHCDLALGTFQRELADLRRDGIGPRGDQRWDDVLAAFSSGLFDDLDFEGHRDVAARRVEELRGEIDLVLHAVRVHGRGIAEKLGAGRESSGRRVVS